MIAVCGVRTGAASGGEIETLGIKQEAGLRSLLARPGGIAAHDTFGRVVAALDAEACQQGLGRWVAGVFQVTDGQVLAIDGKRRCGRHDR